MDTAEVTQQEAERGIPRDTFRARLILARLHAGDLTIREAAARCGLNYGSWANWESGVKPRDKVETAHAISEGLGVDYDWLLHGGPLAKEERSGRVLSRRKKEGSTAEPNVFFARASDHTSHPLPMPASQGGPGSRRHTGVTPTPSRPPATAQAHAQRRTARRNGPPPDGASR